MPSAQSLGWTAYRTPDPTPDRTPDRTPEKATEKATEEATEEGQGARLRGCGDSITRAPLERMSSAKRLADAGDALQGRTGIKITRARKPDLEIGHDASGIGLEHQHTIGEAYRLDDVVGDENNGDGMLAGQPQKQILELLPGERVDR